MSLPFHFNEGNKFSKKFSAFLFFSAIFDGIEWLKARKEKDEKLSSFVFNPAVQTFPPYGSAKSASSLCSLFNVPFSSFLQGIIKVNFASALASCVSWRRFSEQSERLSFFVILSHKNPRANISARGFY